MNSSDLLIRFTNGSKVWGYSSDGFERLRGSNLAGSWCDEMAVYAAPDELFSEALMPALRIGESPRLVITTTPRPIPFLRGLVARDDGSVVVIKGSTWDNAANLSKTALAELRTRYELLGELLSEVAGAFWSLKMIEDTRVKEAPTMARIVVAMDPATTSGEKSDQTGIIVAGRGMDGHLYVLQDLSMKGSPHACMAAVVKAYHNWQADCIVAETNNGGDYLENVLRQVDANVAYRTVRATRGKAVRAEPVSALWEQGRAHIVGCLPELEDQMAACTPPDANGKDRKSKDPDDRVDALVYAATELQIGASAMLYLAAISKMCPKCDKPNVKRAMACKGCGTSLPDADAA
jgi:phage terminase large subunit-like protein